MRSLLLCRNWSEGPWFPPWRMPDNRRCLSVLSGGSAPWKEHLFLCSAGRLRLQASGLHQIVFPKIPVMSSYLIFHNSSVIPLCTPSDSGITNCNVLILSTVRIHGICVVCTGAWKSPDTKAPGSVHPEILQESPALPFLRLPENVSACKADAS